MSTQNPPKKKAVVKLPFPIVSADQTQQESVHNQVRPKPKSYADGTWMAPRGTRRSMGKR